MSLQTGAGKGLDLPKIFGKASAMIKTYRVLVNNTRSKNFLASQMINYETQHVTDNGLLQGQQQWPGCRRCC
jgi:hypothetical protein